MNRFLTATVVVILAILCLIGVYATLKPWATPPGSKTPDQDVVGHFFGPER